MIILFWRVTVGVSAQFKYENVTQNTNNLSFLYFFVSPQLKTFLMLKLSSIMLKAKDYLF